MENPTHDDDSYALAKKKARAFYDKIIRVWCPALNDYVSFNSIGFRHLIWKGRERRPRAHQIKRFLLVPYAPEIIDDVFSKITHRKKARYSRNKWHGVKTAKISYTHFWAFRTNVRGKPMRVIVRQVGKGHKHFLSIFEEEKQKPTHR